jgi:mannose-6-phosphate isomerase-like protein (cupin superfamily)
MIVRDIRKCSCFKATDNTTLCELLHPDREGLNLPYSLAYAVLKPGTASLPHMLKGASEVYYILQGRGRMHVEDESADVRAGQAVYIPPGSRQLVQNSGIEDLKFLCIVHPVWRKDNEEVLGAEIP